MPGDDLFNAVRARTLQMFTAAAESISKLNAQSDVSVMIIWKDDLMSKWSEFMGAFEEHEKLLVSSDEDKLAAITKEFIGAHAKYLEAKVHVTQLLSATQFQTAVNSTLHEQSSTTNTNTNGHEHHDIRSDFKLAPIKITPFSGKLSDWIEFKATCQAVLTEKIPEIQRLQYLKDALLDEPCSLISHILPGTGAYVKAMNLLKTRYENVRAIINSSLREFFSIPHIETPTANAFRQMLNLLNNLVTTLESCDVDVRSWNVILIFVLSQKFDVSTLKLWEEKLEGKRDVPSLKSCSTFLEVRITVLDTTESHTPIDKQAKVFGKPVTKPNPNILNGNKEKIKAFFTLKPEYKCALCNQNHLPSRCDNLTRKQPNERWDAIKKSNLCFNCFYPHPVKDCPFM